MAAKKPSLMAASTFAVRTQSPIFTYGMEPNAVCRSSVALGRMPRA